MNTTHPKSWPHLRWRIAVMLCLVTTINYIDRQALSVTAPVLMEELSLSNTQYGLITSAFLMAYALGQLLSGPAIDVMGSRRSLMTAVGLWSLVAMLHAIGRGFSGFFLLRAALGLTEAANFPVALKVIAEWFPIKDRSMAVGILTAGPGLGAILAPPLIGFITVALGWQWAFIISGGIGFLWIALWYWMYQAPETHPRLQESERQLILNGRNADPVPAAKYRLRDLIKQKTVWGLMSSRFVADGSFYFFVFWLPAYLASERGFSILEIGMLAWMPFLAADLGSLAGGWAGSWLIGKGVSLDGARKGVIWSGAIMVSLAIPVIFVDSTAWALTLIGIAMFATQFKQSALFALPADLYPARKVASVWGVFGAAGSLGGMLFSPFVGWLVDVSSYVPVFIIAGLMHLVSALCVQFFIPRIEPMEPEPVKADSTGTLESQV